MTRVYLLVEGQTEEVFVREVLEPSFLDRGLYLTPIVVSTSPGHRGGVVSYAKIRPQIIRLCRQDRQAQVSTLFDLYALPTDFPGRADAAYPTTDTGARKAAFIEARWQEDISEPNFRPHLLVHEFEALLFVAPERFAEWVDDAATVVPALQAARQGQTSPEDINDQPHTAPSKRILAAMPGYQKTFHGPLIACEIGLDALRQACPHFQRWLHWLDALPPAPFPTTTP
ncbi:MAG: DUF4276 family protein [Sphaerotilus natans]|jgi:hypothetical protein